MPYSLHGPIELRGLTTSPRSRIACFWKTRMDLVEWEDVYGCEIPSNFQSPSISCRGKASPYRQRGFGIVVHGSWCGHITNVETASIHSSSDRRCVRAPTSSRKSLLVLSPDTSSCYYMYVSRSWTAHRWMKSAATCSREADNCHMKRNDPQKCR